ncbi:ion transporter [Marinilabiliaceae bacterium JC017]|nr:ion transporter [Marinilabiliaceae bacterium JC017]
MKDRLYEIIFEADTPAGKAFDLSVIFLIIGSIAIVMIESIPGNSPGLQNFLQIAEWVVTLLFVIEYLMRIWVTRISGKYIFSFFGIVDLLAILPSLVALLFAGTQMLIVFRSIRLLRIFRVLKLTRYIQEATLLWNALKASRGKIGVFLFFVVILVIIMGTIMYLIENPVNEGFSSIPKSVYWAIVTLTTVGYGDIAPTTTVGQFLAGIIMILGYAIIAVPTGIVTTEIARGTLKKIGNTQVCPHCLKEGHDNGALFCNQCGGRLND